MKDYTPPLDVSFIIVNYNTKDLLSQCIDSILSKTEGLRYEIIVVDNSSHDGSVELLRKSYPNVKVVESGGNIGFGRANNKGMDIASGKYLFLLNSDTILLNNAALEFYDKAEELTKKGFKIGVLGAVLLNKDLTTCHSYGRFISPASELREVMAKYLKFLKDPSNTRPPRVKDYMKVDYVTGADMFLPAEVYRATGGFDPDFFMYCEEVDWQKRMEKKRFERYVVDGPEIVHLEGGSDSAKKKVWSPARLFNLYTSRKKYREKHYNKLILPLFRAVRGILDLPSIVLLAIFYRRKEYLKLIKLA